MSDSRSARSAFGLRELLEQRVADRTSELAEKNNQLNQVLSEIKRVSGLIPICMYCKEIRDDKGAWNRLEEYIEEHSDVQFSHGLCENCMAERFPHQFAKFRVGERLKDELDGRGS